MPDSSSERTPHEQQLDALIAEYLQAADEGRPLDQADFLKQHPEFAAELREFFADDVQIKKFAPPPSPDAEETQPLPDSPSTRRRPGTKVPYFGDYEILEELGVGGMGVVYKARQTKLNKIIALKMIKVGQLAGDDEVRRFQAEARAAAKLDHPGIVPVHEVGIDHGQHYYTMDYVAGDSLSKLHRDEPVASRRAAEVIKQMAEAMHYAHGQGIVHRDLKPANVLLTAGGIPRITDFGLAKRLWSDDNSAEVSMTETGQILGTAGYMSPEQAAGKTRLVGPPADIYALGAVLYALLTSRAPFMGESQADTILQVIQKEPVSPRVLNPSIARDLETICLKCVEKEPYKRYGTAQLLAEDLQRFLENRPVLARPIGSLRRVVRWCRRRPSAATALGLTIVLAIGALVVAHGYREALRRSKLQLFQTSVEQAKASRLSGRPGQRLDTLGAVRTGAGLIHELQLPAADTERLRGEAIGALTLLDLERKKFWQDDLPLNTHVAVSDDFECFAYGAPAMDGVFIREAIEPDRQAVTVATRITANSSFFTFAPGGRWLKGKQTTETEAAQLWHSICARP